MNELEAIKRRLEFLEVAFQSYVSMTIDLLPPDHQYMVRSLMQTHYNAMDMAGGLPDAQELEKYKHV